MPIKVLTALFAGMALLAFCVPAPAQAVRDTSRVMRTVDTDARLYELKNFSFRVVTTLSSAASPRKPADIFRLALRGIELQDRDQLSFTILGPDGRVDIGSPDFSGDTGFIELRGHRGAKDPTDPTNRRPLPIGTDPYLFERPKLVYNPSVRKKILIFNSGWGRAQATPVIETTAGTSSANMTVIVHVGRPGQGDEDFAFDVTCRIRTSINRRSQISTFTGSAKSGDATPIDPP